MRFHLCFIWLLNWRVLFQTFFPWFFRMFIERFLNKRQLDFFDWDFILRGLWKTKIIFFFLHINIWVRRWQIRLIDLHLHCLDLFIHFLHIIKRLKVWFFSSNLLQLLIPLKGLSFLRNIMVMPGNNNRSIRKVKKVCTFIKLMIHLRTNLTF